MSSITKDEWTLFTVSTSGKVLTWSLDTFFQDTFLRGNHVWKILFFNFYILFTQESIIIFKHLKIPSETSEYEINLISTNLNSLCFLYFPWYGQRVRYFVIKLDFYERIGRSTVSVFRDGMEWPVQWDIMFDLGYQFFNGVNSLHLMVIKSVYDLVPINFKCNQPQISGTCAAHAPSQFVKILMWLKDAGPICRWHHPTHTKRYSDTRWF